MAVTGYNNMFPPFLVAIAYNHFAIQYVVSTYAANKTYDS